MYVRNNFIPQFAEEYTQCFIKLHIMEFHCKGERNKYLQGTHHM